MKKKWLENNYFYMLLIIFNIHTHIRNKQLSSYDFIFGCCFKDSASTSAYPSWSEIKYLNLK